MTHERPNGTPSEARWGFVMDPTLLELPHRVGPSMIGTKGSKLAAKQHKPEEIVTKLRQIDLLVGHGQYRSMRF